MTGYLNFKWERRKREWYATKRGSWVQWNVYAMNLGRGIVDSVGFPLIGTIEENKMKMSNHN